MINANLKGYDGIFAKRLRELIETKGIKHGDLADKDVLNVSRQAIGQYCNGTALPPADKIVILAQYFNVSADYLLGLSDAKTTDTDLKMIVDYTGLSEECVEKLHIQQLEFSSRISKMKHNPTYTHTNIDKALTEINSIQSEFISALINEITPSAISYLNFRFAVNLADLLPPKSIEELGIYYEFYNATWKASKLEIFEATNKVIDSLEKKYVELNEEHHERSGGNGKHKED